MNEYIYICGYMDDTFTIYVDDIYIDLYMDIYIWLIYGWYNIDIICGYMVDIIWMTFLLDDIILVNYGYLMAISWKFYGLFMDMFMD